jgi:hypothetical protein
MTGREMVENFGIDAPVAADDLEVIVLPDGELPDDAMKILTLPSGEQVLTGRL